MGNPTLARVLGEEFLADLPLLPIEEIRAKRAECQRLEDAVSYLRRLVQTRLDIIGTEVRSRATGEEADLVALIERLPTILAEPVARSSSGRLITTFAPPKDHEEWAVARIEEHCGRHDVERAPDMSDDELQAMAEGLGQLEREVSTERRRLHDIIDRLQAELIRRYKSGQASVEGLLS